MYKNILYLCGKIERLETNYAEHVVNDKIKTNLLENITSQFTKITSAEMLGSINEKIKTDPVYRLSVSNFLSSKIDANSGFKNAIKGVFQLVFDRAFLLTCTWIHVDGFTSLKDTEVVKLIIGNILFIYFHFSSKLKFSTFFLDRSALAFPNCAPNSINEVLVVYLNNLKKNTKALTKKKALKAD